MTSQLYRRAPGEFVDNVVITDEESCDQYFDYFMREVDKNSLKIVGFNMKWDRTMSTMKQRNKNARKNANVVTRYQKFQNYAAEAESYEDDVVRKVRTAKAAYGHTALISLSSLTGVTVLIRMCLMSTLPDK